MNGVHLNIQVSQFEELQKTLDQRIRAHAMPSNVEDPVDVLRRWLFLSREFPRFLGGILARISEPRAQCLVAKNITGECGNGVHDEMHSLLLAQVVISAIGADRAQMDTGALAVLIERKLAEISRMSAGEAIGFLIGLEAPAYDILDLLQSCLARAGMDQAAIERAPYIAIHQAVEKTHQDDSLAMAEVIRSLGCESREIVRGGDSAVDFWSAWWSTAYVAAAPEAKRA